MGWIGLDWVGLGWIGLNWVGLGWIVLDWAGLAWIWLALDRIAWGWVGLDWVGLGWIGMDWIGLLFGFADGAEDAGAPVEAAGDDIVIGAITSVGIAKRRAGSGTDAVRAE